ncbi:MAG: carboxypeptidase-like regulatory domain-containing protein, partial [Bryobacteraceae bacterium]
MQRHTLALYLLILPGMPLFAQTAGSLTGQVTDASQAAISGATVSADNIANGQHRQAKTDNSGRYTIADVPVGRYKVSVSEPNFQTAVQESVAVAVGATVAVDFSLQPGTVNQVVNVTSEAPLV